MEKDSLPGAHSQSDHMIVRKIQDTLVLMACSLAKQLVQRCLGQDGSAPAKLICKVEAAFPCTYPTHLHMALLLMPNANAAANVYKMDCPA